MKNRGYDAFDFKFLTFSMNYNTKMNFTFESLNTSRKSIINLRKLYLEHLESEKEYDLNTNNDIDIMIKECINEFNNAVLDNLNMAKAISYVWKLAKNDIKDKKIAKAIEILDNIMGIDIKDSKKYLEEIKKTEEDKEKEEKTLNENDDKYLEALRLLEERKIAKENKEYEKADKLRNSISELGFLVIDEKFRNSRIERK